MHGMATSERNRVREREKGNCNGVFAENSLDPAK